MTGFVCFFHVRSAVCLLLLLFRWSEALGDGLHAAEPSTDFSNRKLVFFCHVFIYMLNKPSKIHLALHLKQVYFGTWRQRSCNISFSSGHVLVFIKSLNWRPELLALEPNAESTEMSVWGAVMVNEWFWHQRPRFVSKETTESKTPHRLSLSLSRFDKTMTSPPRVQPLLWKKPCFSCSKPNNY